MTTYGSFFSGGGVADIGFIQAGYTPLFASEIDPKIADVYRKNIGEHIRVGDIRDEKISVRGLARFQSIPDWYELPNTNTLACKIIGNGWPTLMARRIAESFL